VKHQEVTGQNFSQMKTHALGFGNVIREHIQLLTAFAQIVLALMATSTTAERILSTTGLVVSVEKAPISSMKITHPQFIHGSYKLARDQLKIEKKYQTEKFLIFFFCLI